MRCLARTSEHGRLGVTVGRHDADGAAVLRDGATAHDGENAVAVTLRVMQAFEHDDSRALTAAVPVGSRVEGLAPAVGRGGPGLVQNSSQSWADQGADTAANASDVSPARSA